jgi:hypothetical protein
LRRCSAYLAGCLAAAGIILCGCANGKWTRADTGRHAAFTALWASDFAQTIRIADNADRWCEKWSPVMDEHPSRRDVAVNFAVGYLGFTAVAAALPAPYREWWQYAGITVEAACVANNYFIGLGFGWE